MKEHYDKEAREYFEMYWSSDELIDKVMEQIDEIERLNKDNGDLIKLFAKEREETKRLHSIIREVRVELLKHENDMEANGYAPIIECLEILDKENV